MKKIIWLFGQPGSGRKTLVDNITNNQTDIKTLLGIESKKISIVSLPYDRETASTNYLFLENRKNDIYTHINRFIHDNNDILIILGEYADYGNKNYNILETTAKYIPDIEKEIIILNPSNLDIAYKRLTETAWFQSAERNTYRFPKEWLDFAIKHMKESLYKLQDMGYQIQEIDTLQGYTIHNNDRPKTM